MSKSLNRVINYVKGFHGGGWIIILCGLLCSFNYHLLPYQANYPFCYGNRSRLTIPFTTLIYHDKKIDSAQHILLPNMYHDNRDRFSTHHILLPNILLISCYPKHHDNIGRPSAHHTLLPNKYHDERGLFSAHHTLLPNIYHDSRGRTLLITSCHPTCTTITEAGSLLTTLAT